MATTRIMSLHTRADLPGGGTLIFPPFQRAAGPTKSVPQERAAAQFIVRSKGFGGAASNKQIGPLAVGGRSNFASWVPRCPACPVSPASVLPVSRPRVPA